MDEIKVVEKFEPHRVFIETPKRSEKILVVSTGKRYGHFKVMYESGKSIPELNGFYTASHLAVDAVRFYLANLKQTDLAYAKDRWGDKPIPVLQKKKHIKRQVQNELKK